MAVKYFLSGFFVKLLAGFDDTVTRISVMSNMTKSHKGRIAFALGIFVAISVVTLIAFLFAAAIREIPYSNFISAGLIFLLALSIQFDLFTQKPKKKIKEKLKVQRVSVERFFTLIFWGFLTAFITIIDDTIAYAGVFLNSISNPLPVVGGIFLGTVLQLGFIVYSSRKLASLKYEKEITVAGLILLSLLLALKVL